MQVAQFRWEFDSGWEPFPSFSLVADLLLVFSDSPFFQSEACYTQLRSGFPQAHILGCSSAGSVLGVEISDADVVVTAVNFTRARVRLAVAQVMPDTNASDLGRQLMAELAAPDLRHVFAISDGQLVNGTVLALGLNQAGLPVTGGLAGDGTRFGKTWIMADAPAESGRIAALGFYGDISINSGCFAGWEEFGIERVVTKSSGNVVYEIDGIPALTLYKHYLGDLASELPSSGLRFPLSIQAKKTDLPLTRTLLAIDEVAQSITFAGDVPQGYLCKMMQANLDSLIDSAGLAAEVAKPQNPDARGLCLLVSCVGRRLVMGQLVENELEIVQEKLGNATAITGFYSYGELAPFAGLMQCQLHNQTMTLTTLYE